MISPGFFGLYNAHRALLTAQTALNVVNHNVANANTPGYTRQRVEVEAHAPYHGPMLLGQAGNTLQMGQGVIVDRIIRLRDRYLDSQFRLETSILGENDFGAQTLAQLEGILAEPSETGTNTTLQNLFTAAQDVSLNPQSIAARTNFLQQAVDMVNVFQQQATQLRSLRQNLVGNPLVAGSVGTSILNIQVGDVNQKLSNIVRLNQQINTILATGAQPNDLLDQRDQLMEELSRIVDITVTDQSNGQVAIDIGGQRVVSGVSQLGTLAAIATPGPVPDPFDQPATLQFVPNVGAPVDITNTVQSGEIRAILDLGGNDPNFTTIRGVIEDLNEVFTQVTNAINTLQTNGFDLNGNAPPQAAMFVGAGPDLLIFNRTVNTVLIQDPTQLAAAINDPTATGPPAGWAGVGDGRNALAMAQVRNTVFGAPMNANAEDFLGSVLSRVGVDSRAYTQRADSQEALISSLDLRRSSVSGVNNDEEMVDLLRFQRMFEASSKMVKVFDEVAQTVINMV